MFHEKAIKVEEMTFNLRGESKKSVNLAQSYVHLKIAKNDQKDTNFKNTWIRENTLIFCHCGDF